MGAASEDLVLTKEERDEVQKRRAYEKAQKDDEDKERDYRQREGEDAARHLRQLGYILRHGKPYSRDPDHEPPPPEKKLEERGRARKQPPIIGVRG